MDWKTQEDIRQKLDPPFEELFDCAEEHVLACLKEPWDSLCRNERREYDMVLSVNIYYFFVLATM